MDQKRCKRSLIAYKGHVTRAVNNCTTLLQQEEVDVVEYQNVIKCLESKWAQYDECYLKVEEYLLADEDTEEEIVKLQDDYYQIQSNYQKYITKLRTKVTASTKSNQSPTTKEVSCLPKLPNIHLPTFSGDITDYESFMDQFQAQIGSRSDLEPVSKLHYLRSQLRGRPLELIKGYTSTSANYQNTLDTLQETYGDDNKIKHCLLQKMVNIESPKHNRSELEAFRVSMLNLTRSLTNKHDYSCCEWVIASLFQHKLPSATIRQLYLKYETNYFDLTELNEGLRDLISHMEVENLYKQGKPGKSEGQAINKESSGDRSVGSYYATNVRSDQTKLNNTCRFCSGSHKENQCRKYQTGTERTQRLKELKLCTRCMGAHPVFSCSFKLQSCRRCQRGNHHSTLCRTFDGKSKNNGAQTNEFNNDETPKPQGNIPTRVSHVNVTASKVITRNAGAALATALAQVEEKGSTNQVRLFFDNGSQRTFITKKLVQKARIPIKSEVTMTVKGFMGQPHEQKLEIVKPIVKLGNRRKRITAVVVEELPETIVTPGLTEVINHLTCCGLKMADPIVENDTVGQTDILIGSDHFYDFILRQTELYDGVHLLNSSAGFIVMGKIPNKYHTSVTENSSSNLVIPESVLVMKITQHFDPLSDREYQVEDPPINKLWDLDVIGIDTSLPIPVNKIAYQDYLSSVQYVDGQYWVKLPWRLNKPELPNNYSRALGQMYSLVKELGKKGKVEAYEKVIHDQLQSNFIEEVEGAQSSQSTHYLPHHAVMKESATTPLRIVFNCSSKANRQSPSLNDCLMTGPTLTRKLGDVLLEFRTGQNAYTADISKAFLRIGLQQEDRDYTRFLWLSDPTDSNSYVKTYRFKSVLFGATSSPFLLQATIDYHLQNSTSPIKKELASQFYVDNFQGTTTDDHKLINIYKEANREMNLANMPLRQWNTNNPTLKALIREDFPDCAISTVVSVLGLSWNTNEDTLALKEVKYSQQPRLLMTKRDLLAQVSRVFDPLGLLTPITIRGKMLLQDTWKLKKDWDVPLPGKYIEQWKELETEFRQVHTFSFPRATIQKNESCIQHIFCDASAKAYGTAAYLTTSRQSHLLTSKARVAPVKTKTIPQLELTAILVGTKLASYILATLSDITITKTYIWSDSEAALQWVKNDNSNIPYVKNRVTEINETQKDFTFMHVDTASNPADLLSRGITIKQITKSNLWFQGPAWLMEQSNWPEQKPSISITPNNIVTQVVQAENHADQVIDIERFSSLRKLIKVTSNVFKFLSNICGKRGWTGRLKCTCPMTFWVQRVQAETYNKEVTLLQSLSRSSLHVNPLSEPSTKTLRDNQLVRGPHDEPSTKTLRLSKLIRELGLYLDNDQLIRCRGRIHNSSLEYGTKHPLFLPKAHRFTQLIIEYCHVNTLHGGVTDTLVNIRRNYWIPKARQAIKNCIRKCVTCKRYDARTMPYPDPPPLPEERVNETRPFQVVGVDYSGPIHLQDPNGDGKAEPTKVYICLFTCATTRAIHLELASDMSAETFLRLFRRFVGRRSCPSLIISDNGSNFRATETFVRGFFQQEEVQQFFESRRCQWKFIPPKAPWQGGFYERMIGTVKRCLRKVLHKKRISLDELRTVLVEIEARVNNRPLTYVNDNINEPEVLTPNHLLQGSPIDLIPTVLDTSKIKDPDFYLAQGHLKSEHLKERFNHINKVLKQWNKIWHDDYLTSLREYHSGKKSSLSSQILKEGDIVLINCEGARSSWPLGKIVKLHPDKNGILRLVTVLSKGITSFRTIEKLIPLEICEESVRETSCDMPKRSSRRAAAEAQTKWRNQLKQGFT